MASIPLTDDRYQVSPRVACSSTIILSDALNLLIFPDPDVKYTGQNTVLNTFDNDTMVAVPLVTYLFNRIDLILGDRRIEYIKSQKMKFVFEWFKNFSIIHSDVVKDFFIDSRTRDETMRSTANKVSTPVATLFRHVDNIYAELYNADSLRMMGIVPHFYITTEPYDFLVNYRRTGILLFSTSSLSYEDLEIIKEVRYDEMNRLMMQQLVDSTNTNTFLSSPMYSMLSSLTVEHRPSQIFSFRRSGKQRPKVKVKKDLLSSSDHSQYS